MCDDAADRARKRALDPILAKGLADARRQMEDAAFLRDRLQTAVTRLRERFEEVKAQEEDERRQLVYDRVKAVRDNLAAELADIYPAFAEKLSELLPRIAANDREIEYVNRHALPRSGARLLVAEAVARGLEGFVKNAVQIPRITEELRLPAWRPQAQYLWPQGMK